LRLRQTTIFPLTTDVAAPVGQEKEIAIPHCSRYFGMHCSIYRTMKAGEILMNRVVVLMLALSVPAFAQNTQIRSGVTVYIEPMGGYETYLAAALAKKSVPLIVTDDPQKAEYIIRATVNHVVPNQADVVINNTATATVNEGESPNQQAWNQGWEEGQRSAERRAERKAALGYSDASVAVVDIKTKQILFAFSSTKDGEKQFQKTAEDFAEHLKGLIEKAEKANK
jgi:hypothetical protein